MSIDKPSSQRRDREAPSCRRGTGWHVNPELAQVSDYMRDLGLGALTHALRLSFYYAPEWPAWPALSVLTLLTQQKYY